MAKKKITLEKLAQMVARGFENTAAKEDIKDMATKEDLKKMTTKEDLKKMATKEDLKKMATKEDLKRMEERLTRQIASLRGELIIIDRKEDRKLDFVINLLRKKNIFREPDLKAIAKFKVFPRIEIHG